MESILRNCSIVSLPSYYGEGLPLILIEAASSGRPIVTTDHPGCRDAVLKNKTAFLVKPNMKEYEAWFGNFKRRNC